MSPQSRRSFTETLPIKEVEQSRMEKEQWHQNKLHWVLDWA